MEVTHAFSIPPPHQPFGIKETVCIGFHCDERMWERGQDSISEHSGAGRLREGAGRSTWRVLLGSSREEN